MNIESMAFLFLVFGVACFITFMAHRLSRPGQLLRFEPMEASVRIMCQACRGHGRIPLPVDPRKFTKHDDAKLKFEDFPLCLECDGIGSRLYLTVSLGPSFVVGRTLASTSMFPQPPLGDYIETKDFPSSNSPQEQGQGETSSTPTKTTSTVSSDVTVPE